VSHYGRSLGEEALNACTHIPVAVYAGHGLLLGHRCQVFLLFSLLTFGFSFLYHISTNIKAKSFFRRLDIASIFWLVPASVYDFLPIYIGASLLLLCCVLSLPVIFQSTPSRFTDTALIILSAAALMAAFAFSEVWMPIAFGLLFYFCGLFFYFSSAKWSHTFWHLFVVAGWFVHFWVHVK